MPLESFNVRWRVAEDEAMSKIVRSGTAIADPHWGHSVHVEVDGLRPGRWYWYQFDCDGDESPRGRTRTAPAAGAIPGRARFAVASCQKYEIGYYTAYEHMVREDIDMVLHLGDYIYEKQDDSKAVRPHGRPEAVTLDEYRIRYAIYKTDAALQAVHAIAPWLTTWDDHEVSNDYAGDFSERTDVTRADFLIRRAAAYQAYYENMPLRRSAMPSGPDMLLYRRADFGELAQIHVLDTRQYRTDQPAGERLQLSGPAQFDPEATILGGKQKRWLFDGLASSHAKWNVLAQQVLMARADLAPGGDVMVDVDKWAGYEMERREVLRFLENRAIPNAIVLTGDKHNNWANELWNDFDQKVPKPVAVEFLGTSISSSGDGEDRPAYTDALLAENPFVKYHNSERGYLMCELTADTWRTDFRTVPYVSRHGAPLNTRASFVVESGNPTLHRV